MNKERIWANNYTIKNVFVGRLPHNSDILGQINNFCSQNNIRSGFVNIIGAVKQVKIGYYDQKEQRYLAIEDKKPGEGLEIVSCTGNISIKDQNPFAHLHIIVSAANGNTFGGHLMPGTVVFAGEFIIQEFSGEDLVRCPDKTTGLPLWKHQNESGSTDSL